MAYGRLSRQRSTRHVWTRPSLQRAGAAPASSRESLAALPTTLIGGCRGLSARVLISLFALPSHLSWTTLGQLTMTQGLKTQGLHRHRASRATCPVRFVGLAVASRAGLASSSCRHSCPPGYVRDARDCRVAMSGGCPGVIRGTVYLVKTRP